MSLDRETAKLGYPLALGIKMSEEDFNKLMLDAVDEGLASIGQSSKEAIYFHLEKSFRIKKHEVPYKIEDFAGAIEKIFGLGAYFLETLIMKRLYEKIGGVFEWSDSTDFTFTEYVAVTKRGFLKKKRTKKLKEEWGQCEQVVMER